MTPVTTAKLVLSAAALGVFIAGVRLDIPALRWVAVGLLFVAFAVRFYRRRE